MLQKTAAIQGSQVCHRWSSYHCDRKSATDRGTAEAYGRAAGMDRIRSTKRVDASVGLSWDRGFGPLFHLYPAYCPKGIVSVLRAWTNLVAIPPAAGRRLNRLNELG